MPTVNYTYQTYYESFVERPGAPTHIVRWYALVQGQNTDAAMMQFSAPAATLEASILAHIAAKPAYQPLPEQKVAVLRTRISQEDPTLKALVIP